MELDKRIIDGKKPLDCFDTEIAKQFIGKKGYFSDSLGRYSVLKSTWNGSLDDIESEKEQCFYDCENEGYFHYFLPAEWVKEPEKKYRPFTGIEFADKFNLKLNSIIHLRSVPTDDHSCYYYKVVFIGYRWYDDVFQVFLNGHWLDLPELLEQYEYRENGEWHKFGVEE